MDLYIHLTIFLKVFKINSVPFLKEDLFFLFFQLSPKKVFFQEKGTNSAFKSGVSLSVFSKKRIKNKIKLI